MDITPVMLTQFRTEMFAFVDLTRWPDIIVTQALNESDAETGSTRWGNYDAAPTNLKRRGMFYFAAHWLATNYGIAGVTAPEASEARLNVASKSIGDESIAYRVPQMMDVGTDWLTFTVYGQQFYRLRKRVGMGAVTA